MPDDTITVLPHLAVLDVQGPDAGTFLQGQLTQDVLSMGHLDARAGGYCSAKGRLLANFVMVRVDEQTWRLVTHAELVESLVKRLTMFVLRARCSVRARPDCWVMGQPSAAAAPSMPTLAPWQTHLLTDAAGGSGMLAIGWWGGRTLLIKTAGDGAVDAQGSATDGPGASPSLLGLTAWQHADILAGWPWVEAATREQFVPQMINLEVLGGVNFRKGCYPGQEVVARSQYRGTLKRRMALLIASAQPPKAGTEVFHSEDPGQPAGLVVNAAAVPGSDPDSCAMLVELKLAAMDHGSLHLGDPQGPRLTLATLPYRIPTET